MKKILASLFVLTAVSMIFAAAATTPVSGGTSLWGVPIDTWVYKLGSDATVDSVYTSSGQVVYGPYSLCQNPGRRISAKSFRSYMPVGGLASGDTVILWYQILPGTAITDTGSTWTAADTLINGKKGAKVDISGLPGVSIAFKIQNADGSKVGLKLKTKIVMQTTATEELTAK